MPPIEAVEALSAELVLAELITPAMQHLYPQTERETENLRAVPLKRIDDQGHFNRIEENHIIYAEQDVWAVNLSHYLQKITMEVTLLHHLALRKASKKLFILPL